MSFDPVSGEGRANCIKAKAIYGGETRAIFDEFSSYAKKKIGYVIYLAIDDALASAALGRISFDYKVINSSCRPTF